MPSESSTNSTAGKLPARPLVGLTAGLAARDGFPSLVGRSLCKPSITFFGEALPKRFGELAPEDFELCDLLVVMGTSLKVQPFACLATFPSVGVPRLLINRDRVGPFHFVSDGDLPIDLVTDVFFQGDCDDGVRELARLAGMLPALESLMAK